MAEAVAEGALAAGADVVELGLCATEMLYFAVGDGGLDAGICVTASHNPPRYTGMKMVREGALPLAGDSGIGEVGRIAADGPPTAPSPGRAIARRRACSGATSTAACRSSTPRPSATCGS